MSDVRFIYKTIELEDNNDIHVKTLRDKQQYDIKNEENPTDGISSANWSLFGVIWDSGKILAQLMQSYDIKNKRILEIGCGIALSSLVLNQRDADISSTDFNPAVEELLNENTRINDTKDIPFTCVNWKNNGNDLGKFDLIIGSDVLYEEFHLKDLSLFLNEHAKESCEVIIVDPARGHQSKFTKMMSELGFSNSIIEVEKSSTNEIFKGRIVKYSK